MSGQASSPNETRPIAVLPIHDPDGVVLSHLKSVGSSLRRLFAGAFIGLTAETAARQTGHVAQLRNDPFFHVRGHEESLPIGDQFRVLYGLAAAASPSDRILHLCYPDRLAYALSGQHSDTIMADIASVQASDVPLIFQRSEKAWSSHPANYRRLEGILTDVGQLLFGLTLDFAWCHLVVTAGQLADVLPRTCRHDLSFVTEIAVQLSDQIKTKDVDWLAWEDPFIHGRDPLEMKAEQEADPAEVHKRLSYVLPMLDVLNQAAPDSRAQSSVALEHVHPKGSG